MENTATNAIPRPPALDTIQKAKDLSLLIACATENPHSITTEKTNAIHRIALWLSDELAKFNPASLQP